MATKIATALNLHVSFVEHNRLTNSLITLQIKLSKICNLFHEVQAGIITLNDIIDMNKKATPEQVQRFFIAMEVYGCGTEMSL